MLHNTRALAAKINKPLVIFDLEHTGGKKEVRHITEFAAVIVTPSGELEGYSSLVRPPSGTPFNPYVVRLTGISPKTVEKAPGWNAVAADAILPYQDAVWVGFNSRAADMPVVLAECQRLSIEFKAPNLHLDLMRLTALKGSLSERVAQVAPELDISGIHRAAKDALLTLWLLEATLPQLTPTQIRECSLPTSLVFRDSCQQATLTASRDLPLTWRNTQAAAKPGILESVLNFIFG